MKVELEFIPTSESLPTPDMDVLVRTKYDGWKVASFWSETEEWVDVMSYNELRHVIDWAYFPETTNQQTK